MEPDADAIQTSYVGARFGDWTGAAKAARAGQAVERRQPVFHRRVVSRRTRIFPGCYDYNGAGESVYITTQCSDGTAVPPQPSVGSQFGICDIGPARQGLGVRRFCS